MHKFDMRKYAVPLTLLAIAACISSCKTTEKNYRQAYERAVTQDSTRLSFDETIYGRHRRAVTEQQLVVGKDTIDVRRIRVRVTPDGGGIRENLKTYCVIAGGFKQLFNARSLRQRLVDNGYPGAFLIETAEPYYYIVASGHENLIEARSKLDSLTTTPPFRLPAAPFILMPRPF